MTISQTFRELGSYLAHETLDAVVDIASILPQFIAEVEDIAHNALPNNFNQDVVHLYTSASSSETIIEELQASCHQIIDQTFDTNQAQCYAPEAKASQQSWDEALNKHVAILPPPGALKPKIAPAQLRQLQRGIPIGKGSPIKPYSGLQKLTKGKQSNLQAHHILEQRHMERWQYPKEAIANSPSQILTREEHLALSNKLIKALPKSKFGHRRSEVWKVYQEIYNETDYPGYLEAIKPFFKLGIE